MIKAVVVLCFVAAACGISKENLDSIINKVRVVGTECVAQEHASGDDVAELMAHKVPPTSHEAKCVIACIYEHYKMMKPDGTFDKQATLDAVKVIESMDAELYGKILKIIDICGAKKQITDDRCETASLMAVCVKTEANAMGINEQTMFGQ